MTTLFVIWVLIQRIRNAGRFNRLNREWGNQYGDDMSVPWVLYVLIVIAAVCADALTVTQILGWRF